MELKFFCVLRAAILSARELKRGSSISAIPPNYHEVTYTDKVVMEENNRDGIGGATQVDKGEARCDSPSIVSGARK